MATQVSIFFGSQSGTAQYFAEELQEACEGRDIIADVIDLRKFRPEDFAARKIVILVVSTWGEGEPPDNAVVFHGWAANPAHDGALKGQRFCVMGLGDMNYTHFNNMGLMTDANLERLGAQRIHRRGVGDDCQDIHEHFEEWMADGLWTALQQAISAVEKEGGFSISDAIAAPIQEERDFHIFFGHEESGGACKDFCEALTEKMKGAGLLVPTVQSLSERKAVEVMRKLPSKSVVVMLIDAGSDGLCAPGRKIVRNMNLDLDSKALVDKELIFAPIYIAACGGDAPTCQDAIKQHGETVTKAFDRVGATACTEPLPKVVDASSDEAFGKALEEAVSAFQKAKEIPRTARKAPLATVAASSLPTAAPAASDLPAKPAAPAASPVRLLFAGEGCKSAAEAAAAVWPGGNISVAAAALSSLVATVQQRCQAVVVVESASGGLADVAKGLVAQLTAAPLPMKAQLRQLKFALLVLGEGDCAGHAEPLRRVLVSAGATGLAQECADPMDLAFADNLPAVCSKLLGAMQPNTVGSAVSVPAPTPVPKAADVATGAAEQAKRFAPSSRAVSKNPVLHVAASAGELPAEAEGEPADVLATFYFEATKAKVLKVQELRQRPDAEQGLSTVEVTLEATGESLSSYSLGGTLSVLPENDPADVHAMLPILGLGITDLNKVITLAPEPGAGKVKKPFPTPCTLAEALGRFCDLGRAPSRRMLQALEPKIQEEGARNRVKKLLADQELMKRLHASPLCCRMHEFWQMFGVKNLDLTNFLLLCPRQKVREFTIASSPKANPSQLSICVSLSSHEMPAIVSLYEDFKAAGIVEGALPVSLASRGRFFGMCSRWITTRLKAGDMILAKHHASAFHLPDKDVPIMMVGAGAGVAPFRGFWEELRRGSQTAPATLFFGCRNQDQDWLYKDEMTAAVKTSAGCAGLARLQVGPKRPLQNLFTAFSRPSDNQKGQYVQDQVAAQATSLRHWLEKMEGCLYICGSSAMGNGVLDALAGMLEGGRPTVDAYRKEGRIIAEMWG